MDANESRFTHIDLFAGIGGFSLAFEAEGFRTIGYSEINPDKCLVYNHWFPAVPNLGDIKRLVAYARRKDLRGRCAKADWWHEINTGVPVLADGLPSRLVEAAAQLCRKSSNPSRGQSTKC